jgi:hypothetical protein
LEYSSDAQGELPESLFLKISKTDLGDESFDDSEVYYYTRDYLGVQNAPLLRCYDAQYSQAKGYYHLLLQDVSETHVVSYQKQPSLAHGKALVEGLAVLHAHWWGEKRLADAQAPIHDAAHIQRYIHIAEPGADHIISALSAELKPHWPALIRQVFAKLPKLLIERTQNAPGFTLIHGDAGVHNILVPRSGDRPLYIIDRQPFNWSLTTWLGVYDLVYATVLGWDVETRRKLEKPLLEHYHAQLVKNGVSDYSRDQLYSDYRLCVGMGIYIATEYCRDGLNKGLQHIWLSKLKQTLTAMDDLKCVELF